MPVSFAFVGVVVFGAGVVNLSSRHSARDAAWMQKRGTVLAPSQLLPWRIVLHGITLAYLATSSMPGFNAVFAVPSVAAASYHFFLVQDVCEDK